jgi:hypothetical protein
LASTFGEDLQHVRIGNKPNAYAAVGKPWRRASGRCNAGCAELGRRADLLDEVDEVRCHLSRRAIRR